MEANINEKLSELEQRVHLMNIEAGYNDVAKAAMLQMYEELKTMYDNIQTEMSEIKTMIATN
ncbi:hypothetical protein ACFWMP_18340 [Paenibacillus sp. NPDC058367]|uniref:Uncharacterized protein n=1 Tax=Paenibacillus odorifer TaxID=189426 RepID=A0ABX3GMZ2_9BACL|nr:hypothetical protein [Paenibacillus odorifer]OMC76798.1 hypothetical protein BK125_17240 [Paenibacillus odorifer]OMD33139.1 hypothetical protein BSO21_15670 [Paenibacillus odorifer]